MYNEDNIKDFNCLPNVISLMRLFLSFMIMFFLWFDKIELAVLLVFVCIFSDWLDGYLARKFAWITEFGKLIDPIADKVLILVGFTIFATKGVLPWFIVVPIFVREFGITSYRFFVINKKKYVIPAKKLGKWKTSVQMFTLVVGMVALLMKEFAFRGLNEKIRYVVLFFGILSLVLSLWSGLLILIGGRYEGKD